jgi:hypothetical protein
MQKEFYNNFTIKKNSKPNPKAFNVKSLFKSIQKPKPKNEELIKLAKKLIQYCVINDQSICNKVFDEVYNCLRSEELTKTQKADLSQMLLQVACQKCLDRPKVLNLSPFLLCKECYDQTEGSQISKCYNCQCSYEDTKFHFACKHLCLFCASLFIRKGAQACPKCKIDLSPYIGRLREKLFKCSQCKADKSLINDKIIKLECRHYHCEVCLLRDIKSKYCITANCELSGPQINFALNFISAKCKICKKRHAMDNFVIKQCCLEDVCKGCQGENQNCLGCKN